MDNRENFEKLFLFEFLVDNVCVFNSKLDLGKEVIKMLGPVAVRFQFLSYPPIEVCEDSFTPSTKPLMEERMTLLKSGKSCMFSLSSLKSKSVINESAFDVYLSVYKYKMQKVVAGRLPNDPPEDVFIGKTRLNMSDVFNELFLAMKENEGNTDKDNRFSRTKRASNKLIDNSGNEVGRIVFLVRVSCFGFMVVTGFKLPEEEQKDFKYKHFLDNQPDQHADGVGDQQKGSFDKGEGSCPPCYTKEDPRPPCQPAGDSNKKVRKEPKPKTRHKKKKDDEDEKKPEPVDQGKQLCCPVSIPPCPCLCYCQKRQGQVQQAAPQLYNESVKQNSAVSGPNDLENFENSQGAPTINGTQPGGQNRARDMDIDPGAVGLRGNQLVFKMPNKKTQTVPVEGKFASTVYYKMDGDKQNAARNVVQILPQNPITEVDKSKVSEKLDVLVLKLGKKRLAAGRKPKLELELRTPKMKEEKPPSEAKETQYLESDIPKSAKAKSDKGSKKGGSKKGGSKKGSKKGKK